MSKKISFFLLLFSITCHCVSKNRIKSSENIEDFALNPENAQQRASSGQLSSGVVHERPSLPVAIRVGKGAEWFSQVPQEALGHKGVRVKMTFSKCQFYIGTGPVIIDQFIRTNKWVEYRMALPPKQEVVLQEGMDGNLRATMDLTLTMKEKMLEPCKRRFGGRKTLIGSFDFNRTTFGLLAAPGSPKVRFSERGKLVPAQKVFLNWPSSAARPQLQDVYELPSGLSTPIYRAKFYQAGYYYLTVAPALSVRLPPRKEKSKKGMPMPAGKGKKVSH